ncbi:MAG TPA: MFS transporter [Candidatus Nanopelagicales bacterium]
MTRPLRSRVRRGSLFAGLPPEVLVLVAVSFCVALGFGIVAPALPVFAKSFDVSATAASAVISVFALVRFISAAPSGWLVDRVGERIVLASGLGIVAVSSALAGLSTTYLQLLLLRGIGGFGSAMFTVSSMGLLLRVVTPDIRGRALGAYQGGFLLGGVAGPAVGGLVTGISIRLPFFLYAGTLTAAVVVVITMLARTQLLDKAATTADEPAESGWASLRRALGKRAYLTALAVNLGSGFTVFGLRSALVPLFVVEALGATPTVTGYGLLASAAVQAVLLLPAGRLADTRGRRPALVLGTSITIVGMVLLAVAHGELHFLVAMAVLGAGTAFLGSAPAAVVGDVTGGRRSGSVVAAYQMTSDFGGIVGPLLAGYIVDTTGSFSAAFLVGGGVVAVGLALSATMPETLRSRKPMDADDDSAPEPTRRAPSPIDPAP